jgi:hypothetical protein
VVSAIIDRYATEATVWLERFCPFLESLVVSGGDTLRLFLPELLLIVPVINKKAQLITATPMELYKKNLYKKNLYKKNLYKKTYKKTYKKPIKKTYKKKTYKKKT